MTLTSSPAAQVDELDALAALVVAATGSTFVSRSRLVVVLQDPPIGARLTVYHGPAGSDVSASSPGLYPQTAFFDLLARAASAVTGDPSWALVPTLVKCHAQALKGLTTAEPNSHAGGFGLGSAEVECDVFSYDGGGCTLTVSRRG